MSEIQVGKNLILKDGVLTLARDPETGRYYESGSVEIPVRLAQPETLRWRLDENGKLVPDEEQAE